MGNIALAYHGATYGDAALSLRRTMPDALADLAEAERSTPEEGSLISHNDVRRRAPTG